MERAVENLIFSNFLLKNFKGNEFSEFASQLLRLWGDRKSKVSSDFEFFKPSLQNNIKVIQSEGFIDKKAIDINSPSNNASVDNSRGGFGADMISKQFYTNELKELNFEEKEQVKQNFEDVFADFKKDTHSISKQSGSEFENFLGFGEGQGTMNNNENNKEETFFFDEIKKNEIKHENSYNYNFGNEYNDNNDYNFNKKNSNDQNFITSGDFQEFNFQTRTPENNQNFFQAPQDNNTNSINFFNEFNQGENIQNTFEKLGPSQNQPVMDKNPFEQFEGVKNDINLNDFGDFENFNDKSKSQENSLEEIKKLAKSNESNPFTINKSSKFDVPKKNSDIMDFWSQDIDQKPENSQNSPEIIPNKKPETDIITEDFFDNFQDFQSENSENQENSSEFFYNNTKNENNNELKLSQLTKTGQKEKNPENLYQNSSDFFNFTEPNPFEKKPSENFQNDNPFDKKQSDNFQAQTQNEENKLDFWENLKITQKFQSLKGPSGTVNPNQGINILDKYEDMQRTPSSLHRGSFEDDDFHKMVNSNDFSKKIDILPENNQKLRRSLTAFSPKENENIEIKLNSQRSMKFINEKEEIKNTDSIKFINDLEELKISQEKNSFDLITSPEIQLNSNNPNLNLNYDLLTLDRKEMEIQEPFNKKNVLTQNPDFLPYDDLDTSSKTGKILAQSFQNSSLPLKENIENIYNPDNFDLISSQNHKNTYETFDNFQQLQSFPNQPLNLMEDFFVDTEKNTQNSNNSLEKPKWIIDLDPNQIDKNTDLIIFSDQNSEGKKASDFNNNEEFLDFPTETDTEQLITPEPDMFQDFKKVDFLEENLIEENKKQIPIKFVNSLRSNDFAIKQELSSIQEDNEEYDIGNNDFMIKNKPTSIQEVNKEYDISSNSLNPKDIESLKNENLKINNRMNELNGLKADFVESKALNQINEEKINSILNDIQTLKQENQIIVKLSQDDNKKIQEKLVLKHENKFNILETNLEQMKEIYKGIKDEQESLKNELKFTIDQQAIIMQPDASIKSIKEDMKELNEKCIKTEQISLKIITKLSSDIESLQDQQKDLEIGYKKNLKNYEVLFDSTKQLLEKVEINSLPLHKELTNEFKKNENDIGKIQENYSSLKTELKSVLQEFQKEVEVIKSGREDDSNKNNKRIVEYQEISKQKLTSIENTINSFKTQFESLKDFYEVLQKDLTKITKLITLDQELSRSKIIKSQSPSQIEPSTQEKKVEEKPTRLFSESPNKRTNKITNSVFSISITPPKNEDKQKYKDIKNETVKKIIRNPANISNSIDYNSHQKKEFLNDTKLSFTDFKEKQIKVDMSHQIMISPLRNNPLENIEKFCNEFTQQDTHGREQFLKKTLKGNNYLKQVWQDPYAILNDYEEKNQNSKSNIFNFSGDVNISINQTTENRQNNNNLSYTDYQMIYGSNNNNRFNGSRGNVRNPNFYICQEKFKRKIVYVSKRYLAKLIKRMNTASSIFKIDVKNFKKACLNTSTILFENNEVLIGSKTKVQGNQIKVSLFISNKTQLPLNHLMLKLQARNRNLRRKIPLFLYINIIS